MEFHIYRTLLLFSFLFISWSPSHQQHAKFFNFTQIANQVGFSVNEYDVITQDGYILKLFNIPGDRNRPVLMMHGIIDSADTFMLRGNASLGAALAKSGYDIWVGNTRGNRYGRQHVYLNPDKDKEFWDFSFHDFGFYDLPAMINFILDRTGQNNLSAIGHSQGNTIFYVLGSTRPEYNDKIKILISLSPICFLSNLKNDVFLLMKSVPIIKQLFAFIGEEEVFGDNTAVAKVYKRICGYKNSYNLCANGLFFPIAGSDPAEMEPDFLPTVVMHYPTGTSMKNVVHVAQVGTRQSFAEFDYQSRNLDIYNSSEPPEYSLGKVRMRVALLAGTNDEISTIKDIKLLRERLPNIVEYRVMQHKKFNHIDSVWGKNMDKYLFPHVFEILLKYT